MMEDQELFKLGINANLFKLIQHLQKKAFEKGQELSMQKALEVYLVTQLYKNEKERTNKSEFAHNEDSKEECENGNRNQYRIKNRVEPIGVF